jgi:hypothetical protein
MFDQDPSDQANISGADFALMCDEIKSLIKQRNELAEALERSTRGLRNVSRWNISDDTLAAITTQIIANENALASVKGAK